MQSRLKGFIGLAKHCSPKDLSLEETFFAEEFFPLQFILIQLSSVHFNYSTLALLLKHFSTQYYCASKGTAYTSIV